MRFPHQARDERHFMSQHPDGSQLWWIAATMWPTRSGCMEFVLGGLGPLRLRYRTDRIGD